MATWLDLFEGNPLFMWNEGILGRQPIPGYSALGLLGALYMLGFSSSAKHKGILDDTLYIWFKAFINWDTDKQMEFGINRYIRVLTELFDIAHKLNLTKFVGYLHQNRGGIHLVLSHMPKYDVRYMDPLAALNKTLEKMS